MIVPTIEKDPQTLTMTVTADIDATVERTWQLWADPRQLERWWGPPGYPASFVGHEFEPGGRVTYFMTSPEGEKFYAYWDVVAVDPPHRLEFRDGFADDAGVPNTDMPVSTMVLELTGRDGGGTRMRCVATYESLEAMEKVISMGIEEGLKAAMSQIPAVLADDAA